MTRIEFNPDFKCFLRILLFFIFFLIHYAYAYYDVKAKYCYISGKEFVAKMTILESDTLIDDSDKEREIRDFIKSLLKINKTKKDICVKLAINNINKIERMEYLDNQSKKTFNKYENRIKGTSTLPMFSNSNVTIKIIYDKTIYSNKVKSDYDELEREAGNSSPIWLVFRIFLGVSSLIGLIILLS